jgi:hypothetical protein
LELKISIEEKKGVNIEKYVKNKLHIKCSNALTARPSGRLYSLAELGRLASFCELQQRSDIY